MKLRCYLALTVSLIIAAVEGACHGNNLGICLTRDSVAAASFCSSILGSGVLTSTATKTVKTTIAQTSTITSVIKSIISTTKTVLTTTTTTATLITDPNQIPKREIIDRAPLVVPTPSCVAKGGYSLQSISAECSCFLSARPTTVIKTSTIKSTQLFTTKKTTTTFSTARLTATKVITVTSTTIPLIPLCEVTGGPITSENFMSKNIVSSPMDCSKLCAGTKNCQSFAVDFGIRTCYLLSKRLAQFFNSDSGVITFWDAGCPMYPPLCAVEGGPVTSENFISKEDFTLDSDCAAGCASNRKCLSYGIDPSTGTPGTCYLLSKHLIQFYNSDAGILKLWDINCPLPPLFSLCGVVGGSVTSENFIVSHNGNSPSSCAAFCAASPYCVSYAVDPTTGGLCYLLSKRLIQFYNSDSGYLKMWDATCNPPT